MTSLNPAQLAGGLALFLCIGYIFYTQSQLLLTNSEQLAVIHKINDQTNSHSSSRGCPACICKCGEGSGTSELCKDGALYPGEPSWMSDSKQKRELVKFLSGVHVEKPEDLKPDGWPDPGALINFFEPLSKKVDLKTYKKKVFIDLGGRDGDSATWFLNDYPHADQFDEIWVFEADPQFTKVHQGKPWKYFNLAVWIRNETVMLGDQNVGSSIVIADQPNKQAVQGFDFSEFLLNHFDYDDFVVCKMDIEGVEFQLVPKLLSDLTIFRIDELMLECHYYEWTKLFPNILRKDCLRMLQSLRDLNLYVHEWN